MGKKTESKQEKRIVQMMGQEEEKAKAAANRFYPNEVIASFSYSSEQNPFAPLLSQVKTLPTPQAPTQEQSAENCLSIRGNVKAGKPDSIEIQLNKGRQLSDKNAFPLGNTVIKVLPMDANEPNYLFIKAGDTLDASVFLGGDNVTGIMLIKDENGEDYFFRLAEFHMLSLRENPDPRKEVGLMTSYLWLTAKVSSSVIFADSLDPIKNLLLSDWLQAEWQRAKDMALKSTNEVGGGESNG